MTFNQIVLKPTRLDILVFRTGPYLCALPLEAVCEVMRCLPQLSLETDLPAHLGLSLIRGRACPVLDLGQLFGLQVPAARLILLQLSQQRRVALAVSSVEGVSRISKASLSQKPPLLEAMTSDIAAAVGVLDGELALVLGTANLLSAQDWAALEAG